MRRLEMKAVRRVVEGLFTALFRMIPGLAMYAALRVASAGVVVAAVDLPTWPDIGAIVAAFFMDDRVRTVLGLILLDVMLVMAAAIKTKEFDWRKSAEFFRTMVIPYVIGYLAFYLAGEYLLVVDWMGDWGELAGESVQWITWAALIANLGGDILRAMSLLNYAFQVPEGE